MLLFACRMDDIFKKSENTKCWQECEMTETLTHCHSAATTLGNSLAISYKVKYTCIV
jgi:hypothetical protein